MWIAGGLHSTGMIGDNSYNYRDQRADKYPTEGVLEVLFPRKNEHAAIGEEDDWSAWDG